jgi:transcriptional regulator with XRE-family HTH domain
MIELGQLLRQNREAKELSLADVEAQTRIRQRYLAALEAGDQSELPNEVVARGFLFTYTRFLGLDPSELLGQFGLGGGATAAPVAKNAPPTAAAPAYRPIDFDLYAAQPQRRLLARRLLGLALLLILALLLGFLLIRFGLPLLMERRTAANTPAPLATLPPEGAPPATPLIVLGATPTPSPAPTIPTATQTTAPAATLAPTFTPTATPIQQLLLLVEVTQRAWMLVTADGQVALEGIREPGSRQEFTARQSLILRTGNAAGLQLTLNNQALPSLGGPGEIVELTWVLTDGIISQPSPTPTPLPPTATATPQP